MQGTTKGKFDARKHKRKILSDNMLDEGCVPPNLQSQAIKAIKSHEIFNHTEKMLEKTQKFEDNFCFKLCCPLLKFLQRASFYNFHNLQHFHLSVKL